MGTSSATGTREASSDDTARNPGKAHIPFVKDPSIEAIAYQAQVLSRELQDITKTEYSDEACVVAGALLPFTLFIEEQLWLLAKKIDPATGQTELQAQRIRTLGRAIQDLYSFLRYVKTGAPQQAPPGIQVALTELTKRHFPEDLTGGVRPRVRASCHRT